MIWSSTSDGRVTYASREWSLYTGQCAEEALGDGWVAMLHPDDRQATIDFFLTACASASPFKMQYRLRRADGKYVKVVVGAAPSISPFDGSFLGYLGALNEATADDVEGEPTHMTGKFVLHPPPESTRPHSPVDVIADHILIARSTAAMNGEERLLASLDFALSEVMRRLGYTLTKAEAN